MSQAEGKETEWGVLGPIKSISCTMGRKLAPICWMLYGYAQRVDLTRDKKNTLSTTHSCTELRNHSGAEKSIFHRQPTIGMLPFHLLNNLCESFPRTGTVNFTSIPKCCYKHNIENLVSCFKKVLGVVSGLFIIIISD